MPLLKPYSKTPSEFLNSYVKMKALIAAFAFSIVCATAVVGWDYYQGAKADKDFCQFVAKSRENQILTAGDNARAVISASIANVVRENNMPQSVIPEIMEQSRLYFTGEIPLPKNLHPSVERLFLIGKPFIADSERRVRERLPTVTSIAPFCKDVLTNGN